jgi:NAD(P)-dependent dehydrogenase (short-subunit alcohol dehydrogenase family)
MSVSSKVILITGAARGLGLEYANSLAAAGAHIVAVTCWMANSPPARW